MEKYKGKGSVEETLAKIYFSTKEIYDFGYANNNNEHIGYYDMKPEQLVSYYYRAFRKSDPKLKKGIIERDNSFISRLQIPDSRLGDYVLGMMIDRNKGISMISLYNRKTGKMYDMITYLHPDDEYKRLPYWREALCGRLYKKYKVIVVRNGTRARNDKEGISMISVSADRFNKHKIDNAIIIIPKKLLSVKEESGTTSCIPYKPLDIKTLYKLIGMNPSKENEIKAPFTIPGVS